MYRAVRLKCHLELNKCMWYTGKFINLTKAHKSQPSLKLD